MSNKSNKKEKMATVNIGTDMRRAVLEARHRGNRGMINRSMCNDLGIAENSFTWYSGAMENLRNATLKLCYALHDGSTPEQIKEFESECFECWKNIFQYCEMDTHSNDLHASRHNVYDLVSVCQKIGRDRLDLYGEQDFVAYAVWQPASKRKFVTSVESILGMMAERVEMMSEEESEYFAAMRRILSKIRKKNNHIKEFKKNLSNVNIQLGKAKSEEFLHYLNERKEALENQISNAETVVKSNEELRDKYEKIKDEKGFEEALKVINTDKAQKALKSKVKTEVKIEDKAESEVDKSKAEDKAIESMFSMEDKAEESKTPAKPKRKPRTKSKTLPKAEEEVA